MLSLFLFQYHII